MAAMFERMLPMLQLAPELAPPLMETVKLTMRKFKAGRQLEQMFDQGIQAFMQRLQQPQQPQGPSPDVVKKEEEANKRALADNMTKVQIAEMQNDERRGEAAAKAFTTREVEEMRGANRGNGQA